MITHEDAVKLLNWIQDMEEGGYDSNNILDIVINWLRSESWIKSNTLKNNAKTKKKWAIPAARGGSASSEV